MWTLLFFVAVVYLIYTAFRFHVAAGIGAVLAVLAYGYFKWYADFCVSKAKAEYSKNPEKAFEWFRKAEKRGMNIGQMEAYAYYLLREGHVEQSEAIYNKLLAQNVKPELRYKLRSDLSVLLMKTGRIDEAIDELEEITLNYTNTTTYGTLGYLYLLKNNRRKAEEYNKEAYDYNSDDPVILDNMIQLYIKMGRYEQAKTYGDKLVAKKPYFIEAYYDTAFVYLKLGDFEKAEEILDMGKDCRITFMSTVKEEDVTALCSALEAKNGTISHKLGSFSSQPEIVEIPENLEYADEDEPVIEYEEPEEGEYDENDPFI